MHVPFPTNPATAQKVIDYNNRITATVSKYLALTFTSENQCKLQQELLWIVDNAKFDLIPIDALPFPIYFCIGNRRYVIPDIGCAIYVESENFNRLPQREE